MLMEDIEEISSVEEGELVALRSELDQREPAPPSIDVEYAQLRFQVMGLEDELETLTQRFATLDHTWDEERYALEPSKVATSSRVIDLALMLLQVKSYVHFALEIEYGREGNGPSELQQAFHCLQTKLAKKEEALRVTTTKVGPLQALLEIERQSSTSDPMMERELACLRHSHDRFREVARDLGFDAARLLCTHAEHDPILCIVFGRLCQAMSDCLGHV